SEADDALLPLRAEREQHVAGRLAELAVARADEQHTRAGEDRVSLDAAAFALDAVQRREVAQRVVLPDDLAARGIVDVEASIDCTRYDGLVDDQRCGRQAVALATKREALLSPILAVGLHRLA